MEREVDDSDSPETPRPQHVETWFAHLSFMQDGANTKENHDKGLHIAETLRTCPSSGTRHP